MLLIRNIGAIVGVRHEAGKALRGSEMDALPVLHDAWLAVDSLLWSDVGVSGPGV